MMPAKLFEINRQLPSNSSNVDKGPAWKGAELPQ